MKSTMLIVDDKKANRAALKEMFNKKYRIIESVDGKDALENIRKYKDELIMIILDVKMPNMNGFNVLQEMKSMRLMGKIPVIMITAMEQDDFKNIGYQLGISDYIVKPFEPVAVVRRVENVIQLFNNVNVLEEKVEEQNQELRRQLNVIGNYTEKMTDMLCTLIEYRSIENNNNIQRVKILTRIMVEFLMEKYPEYGINSNDVEIIVQASGLHDIGKIAIPDSILMKPGKLLPNEYEVMKSHTTKGAEIICQTGNVFEKETKQTFEDVCRFHHERFDGNGYPYGLKGDEIPISAQIVGIVDAYDALISERVYKKSFSPEIAYMMIIAGDCGEFSAVLVNCLKKLKREFEKNI